MRPTWRQQIPLITPRIVLRLNGGILWSSFVSVINRIIICKCSFNINKGLCARCNPKATHLFWGKYQADRLESSKLLYNLKRTFIALYCRIKKWFCPRCRPRTTIINDLIATRHNAIILDFLCWYIITL